MVYSAVGIKCPECARLPRSAIVRLQAEPRRAGDRRRPSLGGAAMGFGIVLLQGFGLFFALILGWLIGIGWASWCWRRAAATAARPRAGSPSGGCIWAYAVPYLLYYGARRRRRREQRAARVRRARRRRSPATSPTTGRSEPSREAGSGRRRRRPRARDRARAAAQPAPAGGALRARATPASRSDAPLPRRRAPRTSTGWCALARDERADLTVVGPEAPLVGGPRRRARARRACARSGRARRRRGSRAARRSRRS